VSKQLTVAIVATGAIVDAVAVADVQAVRGAVAPDRILHKAWKGLGEGRIELPGVDLAANRARMSAHPPAR
jgi:hypothetical protein